MYPKKLIVKKSDVNGLGVFTTENIKKGEIVMIWCQNHYLISENDYHKEQNSGNEIVKQTGTRYVNDIFLYTELGRIEDFVNHSFEPNLLYHCGICFAKRDISENEELFVNYEYLLSVNDECSFIDLFTNKKVFGKDNSLFDSTKELYILLSEITKNNV